MNSVSIEHLDHPILQEILGASEDKCQGYTAYNLFVWLSEYYKLRQIQWKLDSFLKMIILESNIREKCKIFIPLHFTFHVSPKWIKEILQHFKESEPQASVHLVFSSSSGTFVIYEACDGLQMPKNASCEDMKKSRNVVENSLAPDQT